MTAHDYLVLYVFAGPDGPMILVSPSWKQEEVSSLPSPSPACGGVGRGPGQPRLANTGRARDDHPVVFVAGQRLGDDAKLSPRPVRGHRSTMAPW